MRLNLWIGQGERGCASVLTGIGKPNVKVMVTMVIMIAVIMIFSLVVYCRSRTDRKNRNQQPAEFNSDDSSGDDDGSDGEVK